MPFQLLQIGAFVAFNNSEVGYQRIYFLIQSFSGSEYPLGWVTMNGVLSVKPVAIQPRESEMKSQFSTVYGNAFKSRFYLYAGHSTYYYMHFFTRSLRFS